ncbi:hypothetical protein S245_056655 [Arachis hypogaea]|nr:uncharacterized protein DS421_16g552380 [Arachis hypogaea]
MVAKRRSFTFRRRLCEGEGQIEGENVKKVSFAGEGGAEHAEESNTNGRNRVDTQDSKEEEEITVQKLPNGLYNLVIFDRMKIELRKYWWECLFVKTPWEKDFYQLSHEDFK